MLPSGMPEPKASSVRNCSGMSSANFTASRKDQSMRLRPSEGLALRTSSLITSIRPRSVGSGARPSAWRGWAVNSSSPAEG